MSDLHKTVFDFLSMHKKAVFATVDSAGQPHTSLMLYAVDEDLNIYFGTRKAFNKYGQLLLHPAIALSVIEEKLDPLRAVDIHGTAQEVPHDQTTSTLAYLKQKNQSTFYVQDAEDFVMFKIHPTLLRYLDATSGKLQTEYIDLA